MDSERRHDRYECADCESGYVRILGDLGPADPDRWGNRRYTYRCPDCEERFTVTHAPHGGTILPEGLAETEQTDNYK